MPESTAPTTTAQVDTVDQRTNKSNVSAATASVVEKNETLVDSVEASTALHKDGELEETKSGKTTEKESEKNQNGEEDEDKDDEEDALVDDDDGEEDEFDDEDEDEDANEDEEYDEDDSGSEEDDFDEDSELGEGDAEKRKAALSFLVSGDDYEGGEDEDDEYGTDPKATDGVVESKLKRTAEEPAEGGEAAKKAKEE